MKRNRCGNTLIIRTNHTLPTHNSGRFNSGSITHRSCDQLMKTDADLTKSIDLPLVRHHPPLVVTPGCAIIPVPPTRGYPRLRLGAPEVGSYSKVSSSSFSSVRHVGGGGQCSGGNGVCVGFYFRLKQTRPRCAPIGGSRRYVSEQLQVCLGFHLFSLFLASFL